MVKTRVLITDPTGKLITQRSVNNGVNNIDTSSLPKGVYFVQMISDEGSITKKIIKK